MSYMKLLLKFVYSMVGFKISEHVHYFVNNTRNNICQTNILFLYICFISVILKRENMNINEHTDYCAFIMFFFSGISTILCISQNSVKNRYCC